MTSCPPCTNSRACGPALPRAASSAAASCSALRDLYGRDGAETVSGLCGTRVVLAAHDRDTAEWSAESLGRAEIEEMAESVNYGIETPRDGVTLGARRALRPLVLPAEVARLDSLAGYLKFPGAWPVARIKLQYRKRPQVAERFVPWESKGWGVRTEEAGRSPSRPRPKAAEVTSGGAEVAAGWASEAEAAVDLWELDSMEAGRRRGERDVRRIRTAGRGPEHHRRPARGRAAVSVHGEHGRRVVFGHDGHG